jgi:hypothetical protein
MYINISTLIKLPNPLTLPLLLILKQANKKDLSEHIISVVTSEEDLNTLEEGGYISYVKGKKGQTNFERMRLGKKGREFLNDLDEPEVEDQDERIFKWLSEIYNKKEKQIGNGKKTKRLIASFREKSGIEKNHLAFLCNEFILDDSEQDWSFKLEFVFWKPSNLFQTKFVLEDSRLWKYYNKKKAYFDKKFLELDNK